MHKQINKQTNKHHGSQSLTQASLLSDAGRFRNLTCKQLSVYSQVSEDVLAQFVPEEKL